MMKGVVWPLIVTMAIQALVSLVVYTPPVLAPVAQTDIGTTSQRGRHRYGADLSCGNLYGIFRGQPDQPLRRHACKPALAGVLRAGVADDRECESRGLLRSARWSSAPATESSHPPVPRFSPNARRTACGHSFSRSSRPACPIGGALAGALIPLLMAGFGWKQAALAAGVSCLGAGHCRAALSGEAWISHRTPRDRRRPCTSWSRSNSSCRTRGCANWRLRLFRYSGMQMCMGSFLDCISHRARWPVGGCRGRGTCRLR